MTKCVMRELEFACSQNKGDAELFQTLKKAKLIHKCSCKHGGGIIEPDECIMNFVDKKNEEKIFVGTNDQNLCRRHFSGGGNLASKEATELVAGFDNRAISRDIRH